MDRSTGMALGGLAHLRQSIGDILSTPIGSRVMRRDYGSLVPELIDQPDNDATQLRVFAATAAALMRWEPRLQITQLRTAREAERPGHVLITITGAYLSDAAPKAAPLDLTVTVQGARA